MSRLEHHIERDLRQIADRATPSPNAWNAILTRIADQDPETETEIIMLTEATPRSRRWLLFASAAAAVLAIIAATVVAFALNDTSSDDGGSPSPTAVATIPPTTTVPTRMKTVSFTVSSANDMPVTFSVPYEWTVGSDRWASKGIGTSEVGLIFAEIAIIYADGCQWTPADPPVGPTVDDLVQAWASVPNYAATAAVDVTVDGYAGKQIEFTVPEYDIGECRGADSPAFGLWTERGNAFPGFEAQGPNQHTEQQILDVDGTRLVITAYYLPSSPPQDRAALDQALASIQFGPIGNPFADIRARVVDESDIELFRMNSDTERYWRLTTLPEFDGRTFKLPSRPLDRVDDIDAGVPEGRTIRQQIQILALTDKMVPAAADVFQVAPNADMRFNQDTGTLLKLTDLVPGEQFTIVSRAPDITVDDLRAATTDNPPDEIFLGLPDDVPDIVYATAAEVTAGKTTDYDRLIALQDWFRSNFEYSTDVQSGHGNNAIENFLQIRNGYCEQFAATFAVMARTLGIPSRVAVGYTPGQLRSDGWYSVTGRNSHAWPEIWFDGTGWVDFEPTPQRGIPGAENYTGVEAEQQTG